jgi:RNA polymerase sigma-70 factor (ECF subfamily)
MREVDKLLILAINIIESSAEKSGIMTDDEVCEVICRSNDEPEIFSKIIDCFSPIVYTVIKGMFERYRKADFDDAVSNTFLLLWQTKDKYDMTRGSYANYVILTARKSAISILRKIYRERDFFIEENFDDLYYLADNDTEKEVFSNIDNEIVHKVISALPDDDRNLIVCKYFYMMSVRDIAKRTQRSEKSIESRLYKLRVKLREEFIKHGITEIRGEPK